MNRQRRSQFYLLVIMSVLGIALEANALRLLIQRSVDMHALVFFELMFISLVLAPWSVKLPSGATWRPGIPLMMLGIFLIPPPFLVLIPVPVLMLITARAKAPWWKYFETISHVSVGMFAGGWVYRLLLNDTTSPYVRTMDVLIALLIHLVLNRFISAVIVSNRENRPLFRQLRQTFRELHWGYFNSYVLILLASMVSQPYLPLGIAMIGILQGGIFMAVAHYSHIETLQRSLWVDGLTNVANRTAWERLCDMDRVHRRCTGIGVIDIDNFKEINDRFGHLVGDDILREVSRVLQLAVPKGGRVFRVGGDEFVVTVSAEEEPNLVAMIERTMRQESERFANLAGEVTVSVGQAAYPQDGSRVLQLFEAADRRMYEAKRGKSQVRDRSQVDLSGDDVGRSG